MNKTEVLETLRLLATGLRTPVWLAGGLAADFHVERWTRDHDDIDLVAYEEGRKALAEQFAELGYTQTDDRGWITRWTRFGRSTGEVALAYERRVDETTGDLVIRVEDAGDTLVPGVYPGVPGNLDPERFRTLEGVRFRVMSAEDEWVFAKRYRALRPTASTHPTVEHNLSLLETILDEDDRERLRPWIGRSFPLESPHDR
ncbi:MAG: nucleotidyltransferase domain-containing protein [Actinomycetota bacterium]